MYRMKKGLYIDLAAVTIIKVDKPRPDNKLYRLSIHCGTMLPINFFEDEDAANLEADRIRELVEKAKKTRIRITNNYPTVDIS